MTQVINKIKVYMPKEVGTVKWFNDEKGYGFISRSGKSDVFVHQTNIQEADKTKRRTLVENQSVEFGVESGEKGPIAVNVVKL